MNTIPETVEAHEELVDRLREKYIGLSKEMSLLFLKEGDKPFYSKETHWTIQYEFEKLSKQVYIPLPKTDWPEQYIENDKYEPQMKWPNWTFYNYSMDVVFPPHFRPTALYFGYALYQDKLVPCAFFVTGKIMEQTFGEITIPIPTMYAVDPIATRDGIEPECYVGVSVAQEHVQQWLLTKKMENHPLEAHVRQVIEKVTAEREKIENERKLKAEAAEKEERERIKKENERLAALKKVFILRHGDYIRKPNDPDPILSEQGKADAQKLADKINSVIGERQAVILTSPAKRAFEMAKIIEQTVKTKSFTTEEKLWCDNTHHNKDFKWLKSVINGFDDLDDDEVLVIISHMEYVQDFPEELGFSRNSSEYASGIMITYDTSPICELFSC